MKKLLKQLGKAVCYGLVFVGIQLVMGMAFGIAYGVWIGVESAMTGAMLNEQQIEEKLMEFTMASMNWLVLVSGVLTVLVLWVFFAIRKKKLCREAQIHRLNWKGILMFGLLGIAISFCVSFCLSLLPIPESVMEEYMEQASGLEQGSVWLRLLATVIVGPIVEELVFRGLVQSRLRKAMKPAVAILLTSVAFGLLHGQPLWMAYTIVFGVILGIVAEKAKSITPAIMIHIGFNSVSVFGEYIGDSVASVILIGAFSIVVIIVFFLKRKCWFK